MPLSINLAVFWTCNLFYYDFWVAVKLLIKCMVVRLRRGWGSLEIPICENFSHSRTNDISGWCGGQIWDERWDKCEMKSGTNMWWKVGQIQDGTLVHRLIICGIIDRGTESEYKIRTHSDHPLNVFPCLPIPTTSSKLQMQPKPIRGSRMQDRFS